VLGVKRPDFRKYESEALVNIAKTSAWQKLRLTAHTEAFRINLMGASNDFMKGYLECFATLDETIKNMADEESARALDDIAVDGNMDGEQDF